MENPLGKTIGNSVEVLEAIECLKGGGPSDILEVICTLGIVKYRLVLQFLSFLKYCFVFIFLA